MKLQVTDLRIGNLVVYPSYNKDGSDKVWKVRDLFLYNNEISLTDGRFQTTVSFDSIRPVILTELLLLNGGFEKQKSIIGGGVFSKKHKRSNCWFALYEKTEYEDPNELSLKELKRWWSFSGNAYDVKIEFAHQLQNLFFALTTDEIIFKNINVCSGS